MSAFPDRKTRKERLERLDHAIRKHESAILDALHADLGKSPFEATATEVREVREEIRFHIRHLRRWMRARRVPTPRVHFGMTSRIHPEPLGEVLIIAPWNYPFNLCFMPAIGALSAGNRVVLKPSEMAPHTARVIESVVSDAFTSDEVRVVQGGVAATNELLARPFDHIFFTGSETVGRIVMEKAARHLTPVTLELGGKSPVIVTRNADVALAARRIVWGKSLNAGQTCVAPDHVLVEAGIRSELIAALKSELKRQLGPDPETSPDFGRIIHDRHFERLNGLLAGQNVISGGESDAATRYLAPTLVLEPAGDSPLMTEEIFGPILPILSVTNLADAIDRIRKRPKPLALYLFSKSGAEQQRVLHETSSGGVCINDTILQVASPHLPFGGVGASGMGSYHGRRSFETFSHMKSVMRRTCLPELPHRYPPYPDWLHDVIRRI